MAFLRGAGSAALLFILAIAACPPAARAEYPQNPIKLIVPFPGGGATDLLGRNYAQFLSEALGQPVVVHNRPGAAGGIGSAEAARADPDGYTLLIGASATHSINPILYKNLAYDAVKDFVPISGLAKVPNVLVTSAQSDVRTLDDLIQKAKAEPGLLNYGSGGSGTSTHLAMELFKTKAGIDIQHIPYKGTGEAKTAVLGEEVQFLFDNLASAIGLIKDGRLRPLGVSSSQRVAILKDVPTLAEQGIKGFEADAWFAVYAPANLPPAITERLNQETRNYLTSPATIAWFDSVGAIPFPTSQQGLAAYMADETEKWSAILNSSAARVD